MIYPTTDSSWPHLGITGILCVLGILLAANSPVYGQTQITGTVVDSTDGQPLPGVNVVVVGTQQGTTTDSQGEFALSVDPGDYEIQASFVGYSTQTRSVSVESGETATVDFSLSSSDVALEEMVVTALGVERQERSLSYSTQEVGGAEIQQARELNVGNSLSGKVSGLRVNQAGTGVGGDVRMVIRGNRSISGDSQPLFVVDGVPIRGDIGDLNPDDIESVEVLKGPNAAALYGNDAQNGAVLITTETPEAEQLSFSFSQNIMARTPMIISDFQNTYGQGSGGQYQPGVERSWGPEMNGQTVEHWSPAPEMQGEQYEYSPQPDNVSDVFQTGLNSSTNLKANMGAENIQGLFSYTLTEARGTVPRNDLQRHNLQVRVTGQPTDNLSVDGKLTYNREEIQNSLATGENFTNPIRHALRLPRNIRTEDASNFEYENEEGLLKQNFWNPGSNGGANPYWAINRNLNDNTSNRVIGLTSATYDFTDNFNVRARGSFDVGNDINQTRLYNDTYIVAEFGQFSEARSYGLEWNGDLLMNYSSDITENWSIDTNVGGSIKQERGNSLNATTGDALIVPNFFSMSNTNNVQVGESEGAPRDVQSLYGQAEIAWGDAIFLNLTGRNDWSSTLPRENWSFFYPSVGLSAVLTELVSMPEAIDFLRVRGSWAEVGNEAQPFQTVRTASFGPGGNNGFLQLSGVLPAEDLKPEQTESWEFGTQIRTFGNRLELDATYYHTETRNQLFTLNLPVASGASQSFTNGGNIRNRGVELSLTGTFLRTNDYNWDTTINFSKNDNLVKRIHEQRPRVAIGGSFLGTNFIEEGKPFGIYYSRGFQRDDQGRVIVGDDGIPELTEGETVPIANFNPDWTGSVSSTFSYENLNFSFLIDHRQGGQVGSFTNAVLAGDGVLERTLDGRGGGLVFGENVFPEETAVNEDGSPNDIETTAESFWSTMGGRNTPVGEAFSSSATATKLREVTLGYTFPESLFETLPVRSMNVSLVGRDLFWIYRESSRIDPDILTGTGPGAEGFESFSPPTTRSFGVNFNMQF